MVGPRRRTRPAAHPGDGVRAHDDRRAGRGGGLRRTGCDRGGFGAAPGTSADERVGPGCLGAGRSHRIPAQELVPAAPPQIEDVLALSPLQEGLFALYRMAQESADGIDLYTMQLRVDIDGPADFDLLRRSAAAMLDRHP